MESNEQDEVIVDNVEDTNEEVAEETEETPEPKKSDKPKRTPQEEYEYHMGRAKRAAKKLGIEAQDEKVAPVKNTQPERSSDLEYGQLALLRTEGIRGSGEIALFKEVMAETGKGVLDVLDSNYFKSRLADFREAEATQNAIPKGKKRSSTPVESGLDEAMAKYKDTGELPKDFATRNKLVDEITRQESGEMFSGPAVIGGSK